tara:strand:- start:1123 stop:1758 length:636 start_codon:yes stop_codon:yes gene_type:complete
MKKILIFLTICLFAVFGAACVVLSYLAFQQVSGDYIRFSGVIANFFQTFAVLCILVALVLQYIQTRTAKEHKFAEVFFQLLKHHQDHVDSFKKSKQGDPFESFHRKLEAELKGVADKKTIGEKYENLIEGNADLKNYYRSLSYLLKLIINSGLGDEEKSYYKHQIRMHQSSREKELMFYNQYCPVEGERFKAKLDKLNFSLKKPIRSLIKE